MCKATLLVFAIITASCESIPKKCENFQPVEPLTLNVDHSCTERANRLIAESVEQFNTFTCGNVCDDLVILGERTKVSHDTEKLDQENILVCYNEKPEWYQEKGLLGIAAHFKSIRLFFFKDTLFMDNYVRVLVLHELFHYVGIYGHSTNKKDVMYKDIIPTNKHYTKRDRKRFCSDYACAL